MSKKRWTRTRFLAACQLNNISYEDAALVWKVYDDGQIDNNLPEHEFNAQMELHARVMEVLGDGKPGDFSGGNSVRSSPRRVLDRHYSGGRPGAYGIQR